MDIPLITAPAMLGSYSASSHPLEAFVLVPLTISCHATTLPDSSVPSLL